ncbi:hypothetical protein ARZXY2_3285 [Arthrobacter sp. ZXY-2]|nr:hypothetical protein ARZXY2_3285 [Arthrobacter sp. ZXY-2]
MRPLAHVNCAWVQAKRAATAGRGFGGRWNHEHNTAADLRRIGSHCDPRVGRARRTWRPASWACPFPGARAGSVRRGLGPGVRHPRLTAVTARYDSGGGPRHRSGKPARRLGMG